jgi:GNAT superfamily N-acetyltransferase
VRPPVEVRSLRAGEAEALARLTVAAYTSVPGFDPGEAYLAELADVGRRAAVAVVLVAVDADGAVVGGATYVPGISPYAEFDDPADAGIRMLAVAPEAQGRGVGAALVRACVARARAEERPRLWLHTTEHMTAARRLYEREGFRRAPDHDWQGTDLRLLSYRLDLAG